MSQIVKIASIELSRLVRQPAIVAIAIILLTLSAINGITTASTLPGLYGDELFMTGLCNIFYYNSLYTMAISMFIGVMSISEDRSSGSLRTLLTKPLYRRDVLAGKFVGTLALIMLIVVCCALFGMAMIMIFSVGPESVADVGLRACTYLVLIFLNCALTLSITMAIGMAVKNSFGTLICIGVLFFFNWFAQIPRSVLEVLGNLIYLNQRVLYFNAVNLDLFTIGSSYRDELYEAFPFIMGMLIATILFASFTFFLFCREDE